MSCASLVVRGGADAHIDRVKDEDGVPRHVHTVMNVHREMLYQVASDYGAAVGPAFDMELSTIRYWYEGLRAGLRDTTKPPKK
jgi:hypothetical protein